MKKKIIPEYYEKRFNKKIEKLMRKINEKEFVTLEDLANELRLKKNSLYFRYLKELEKRGIIITIISNKKRGRPYLALSRKPITNNNFSIISIKNEGGIK